MLLFYSMGSASEFAPMCESFPRHVRATGISIAYALAVCVLVSLAAVAMLRETAGERGD